MEPAEARSDGKKKETDVRDTYGAQNQHKNSDMVAISIQPEHGAGEKKADTGAFRRVAKKWSSKKAVAAAARTWRRNKNGAKKLAKDFTQLRKAFEPLESFYFMRNDAHPIYGLTNWSAEEWAKFMQERQLKTASQALAQALDLLHEDGETLESVDINELSLRLKEKLSLPLAMSQWTAVWNFQNAALNLQLPDGARLHYMRPELLSNMLFDREFPLGVEDRVIRERSRYAISHSGLHQVGHAANSAVTLLVYLAMLLGLITLIAYLAYTCARTDLWTLEATSQDPATVTTEDIAGRVKGRAQAASLVVSVSFSLVINGLLDMIGQIDPSTSTVFVGITLGGTWGFVLDNLLGTDEGFREYLWDPVSGMRYAMGTLGSGRYVRFVVTLLFDMYITVILFKALYTKLVQVAGFTVSGREWIANGFTSSLISVITFAVYANLTRTQWAYPSGEENVLNQWISGHMMTLATVIMNMVYLVCETRARIGEPGINDPNVKIIVTGVTFAVLFGLASSGQLDPSLTEEESQGVNSTWTDLAMADLNLPLNGVCYTRTRAWIGFLTFIVISMGCLGIVVFGTSAQSLTGLRALCCGKRGAASDLGLSVTVTTTDPTTAPAPQSIRDPSVPSLRDPSMGESSAVSLASQSGPNRYSSAFDAEGKRRGGRNAAPVTSEGHAVPVQALQPAMDRLWGKCALFWFFLSLVMLNLVAFTFIPIYSAEREGFTRDMDLVRQACDNYE